MTQTIQPRSFVIVDCAWGFHYPSADDSTRCVPYSAEGVDFGTTTEETLGFYQTIGVLRVVSVEPTVSGDYGQMLRPVKLSTLRLLKGTLPAEVELKVPAPDPNRPPVVDANGFEIAQYPNSLDPGDQVVAFFYKNGPPESGALLLKIRPDGLVRLLLGRWDTVVTAATWELGPEAKREPR